MKTIKQDLINVCVSEFKTSKAQINRVAEPLDLHNANKNLSNRRIKIFWLCIFIILISTVHAFSQNWNCYQRKITYKPWAINANFGKTSYFGDLSIYDQNIPEKISQESGNSFGIVITKHLNKVFGLSGQVLYGQVQANHRKYNFRTKLLEYNLHAKIDLINIFSARRANKVGVIAYAGVGHLFFKTVKNVEDESQTKVIVHQSNVPEFIYFFGGGVYYNISSNISVTLDLALKQFQNDRLDGYVHGDDFDYYSYLSFGITYNFYNFSNHSFRRIAFTAYDNARLRRMKRKFQ